MKAIALISENISNDCRTALCGHGFFLIPLPSFPILEIAVRSHPDMLVFPLKSKLIVHESYQEIAKEELELIKELKKETELVFTNEPISDKYPNDILFNGARVGAKIFAKTEFFSKVASIEAKKEGLSFINVRQGYSACSSCVVDDESIITSDRSIAKEAEKNGVSVLLISEGHIRLPHHEYGFIGGASGVYEDKVFFLGNIDSHPDSEKIKAFITERGKAPVSLSNEPLFDGGKILFI